MLSINLPLDILKIQARIDISDPVNAKRGVEIEWIKHHDCVAFLTLPLSLSTPSKVVTSRVDSLDGEDSLLTKGERTDECLRKWMQER